MLKTLQIHGLRGFASNQVLDLALPNNEPGSGLTVLVGPNNAGKSTAVEALLALSQPNPPSFTRGRRNSDAGDQVTIKVSDDSGRTTILSSIRAGGSETRFDPSDGGARVKLSSLFVLPARRYFNPYFGRGKTSRDSYMSQGGLPAIRTASLDHFANRLFAIQGEARVEFDKLLKRVVDPAPDWSIDQEDNGAYFLKIRKNTASHSSEGMGEGLVSLLFIIDALYDSRSADTIAIDEPELSLHPALQRKLFELFLELSRTRQILLATHSPYFIGLDALANGATVARVHAIGDKSTISQLSAPTARDVIPLLRNENNPHILGPQAREIFFVDENVILVEGQEDVIFYDKVQRDIERLNGTFFGWGVGGAANMARIARVMRELGFQKVVGILDGNQVAQRATLTKEFPSYHFCAIPANDVRTKREATAKPAVQGLLDDANVAVRPEHVEPVRALLRNANSYLST